MKFLILATLALSFNLSAAEIKNMPLDFRLQNSGLKDGQIFYGSQIMSWQEWINRPTSGPLLIETPFDKRDIEVFEARAATIVKRPASFFTEKYLLNLATIKKLNPQNRHQQIASTPFTVETIMPFPPAWADLVGVAKRAKLLDDKTTDFIRMESAFAFASRQAIDGSPQLKNIISLLDISGLPPEAMSLQGTLKVNQIADFISIVTVFYKVDEQRTLVVTFFAVALKKHLLNKGTNFHGLPLNGRSILMGENRAINSEKGISAGLPKYFLEFYENMTRGFVN